MLELESCVEADTDAPVVRTALELWSAMPNASALAILDAAMRTHSEEDMELQFEYELLPPHPFAELLRLAFAPHLDAAELLRATEFNAKEDGDESIALAWDHAILLFAERYGIWGPRVT